MKLSKFCKNNRYVINSLKLLLVIIIITILDSCHKEGFQDASYPDAISEYITFYEGEMQKSGTKGCASIPHRSPQWAKATIKKWHRGDAAVAPLDYDMNYSIRSSTSPYIMNIQASSFLMVNKGSDGSMNGEIVYIIPDGLTNQSMMEGQIHFSGTIVTENLQGEFLAAYICRPDGSVMCYLNSRDKDLRLEDAKGLDCWTYELWQTTSIDGGESWSEPTLISSYTECYYTQDIFYFDTAYDYYDLGGGGGGGEVEDISSNLQSFRPLTADEFETLESIRISISQDCATNNVINTVWSSLNFNVNSSISTPAQYNSSNNTITFRNSSSINANAIMEELFHAYQNAIYPGGIGQYSMFKPGWTNLEFEAKLFNDVYTTSSGTGSWSGGIGFPDSIFNEYVSWVIGISEEGFTPSLMAQYSTILEYFNQYNSVYGGYLLPDLDTPLAIIQSKSGCN